MTRGRVRVVQGHLRARARSPIHPGLLALCCQFVAASFPRRPAHLDRVAWCGQLLAAWWRPAPEPRLQHHLLGGRGLQLQGRTRAGALLGLQSVLCESWAGWSSMCVQGHCAGAGRGRWVRIHVPWVVSGGPRQERRKCVACMQIHLNWRSGMLLGRYHRVGPT